MQEDMGVLLTQTREDIPLFVFGHSTGTLLALNLAINNPRMKISGIISSSVSLHPEPYSSKAKSFVSKYLLKLLSFFEEDVTLLSRLNPTAQSKNNFTCIKMIGGIFKNYKITIATYSALESLSNFVREYIFRFLSLFLPQSKCSIVVYSWRFGLNFKSKQFSFTIWKRFLWG